MQFRPYTNADLETVVAIFRSNIPKYFSPEEEAGLHNFFAERAADYYVVEVAGEVTGAGGIALNDDRTVSLCWGMLRSDYIGKGLGRALTEFRIAKARENFGPLPLVISTSQHTQGFYEKFAFRLTERTADGFGPGIDTCQMRLAE
jgi:ribosomal-protein-alanine N-acetyltransferase